MKRRETERDGKGCYGNQSAYSFLLSEPVYISKSNNLLKSVMTLTSNEDLNGVMEDVSTNDSKKEKG